MIFHLPSIEEDDYPAFRRVASNSLPETFYEWLELTDRHIKQLLGRGQAVRPVGINAAEFSRYRETHAASSSVPNLYAFAAEMAAGKHY